jgi:16S rRNA (uracil1498-N3)-methyltransferase
VDRTPGPSVSPKEPGPWFIAPLDDAGDGRVVLDAGESHHAVRVLRVATSDPITVTDGRGTAARCVVTDIGAGSVVARVLETTTYPQPRPQLLVYQGAAKGKKLDDVVRQLAQMGVARLSVYRSARSVVRWEADKDRRLVDRWATIARSAAKQSRSAFVMETGPPLEWSGLISEIASEAPHALVLWEDAKEPLRGELPVRADRIALVVGPEGGLGEDEADALRAAGCRLVSLGPRILRTELAPVVAVAALLYHYGRLG